MLDLSRANADQLTLRETMLDLTAVARSQLSLVEAAAAAGGVRTDLLRPLPAIAASAMLRGPFRIKNFRANVFCVLTNKTPVGTYRSPGRYEANFVRERLADIIAHRLRLDPADVRRRNLIRREEMPYDLGKHPFHYMVYDTGDFIAQLDLALDRFGYDKLQKTCAAARQEGRAVGTGDVGNGRGAGGRHLLPHELPEPPRRRGEGGRPVATARPVGASRHPPLVGERLGPLVPVTAGLEQRVEAVVGRGEVKMTSFAGHRHAPAVYADRITDSQAGAGHDDPFDISLRRSLTQGDRLRLVRVRPSRAH